jgi:ABC-2 type transport system permease protein
MSAHPVPSPRGAPDVPTGTSTSDESARGEAGATRPVRQPRAATVVRPRIKAGERLRRLWRHRELLNAMVRKELKVKYKNSILGFAWSLLNPLLYLFVFWLVFDKILHSGIPSFAIWLLSGLLVWNLFSIGLGGATGSIVGNAGLLKKVAFPREILPLAAVGSNLVHFFLQSLVLLCVLAVTRWHVAWSYIPLVPVALVALLLVTASLGILLAAVNVYLRDTQHFLELALLAWFWMTPVVYGFNTIGHRDNWATKVYMANPVVPIVLVFQRAIYAKMSANVLPNWSWGAYAGYLGMSFGFALIMFTLAFAVFSRSEANFAEEL